MPGNETYMVNPHKRAPPGRVRVRVQLLQRQRRDAAPGRRAGARPAAGAGGGEGGILI